MTKLTKRKPISQQKRKKTAIVPKTDSLQDHFRELLIKANAENYDLRSQLRKSESKSSDHLLKSCKYLREWISDIRELTNKFNTLDDTAEKLRTDFNTLLLNPNAEEIKDRITLCKKLEVEIPGLLKIINGKNSALKEILNSLTESLREIEEKKGVLNV
jgi:type VI protein secretion system component VasK